MTLKKQVTKQVSDVVTKTYKIYSDNLTKQQNCRKQATFYYKKLAQSYFDVKAYLWKGFLPYLPKLIWKNYLPLDYFEPNCFEVYNGKYETIPEFCAERTYVQTNQMITKNMEIASAALRYGNTNVNITKILLLLQKGINTKIAHLNLEEIIPYLEYIYDIQVDNDASLTIEFFDADDETQNLEFGMSDFPFADK